MNNCIWPPRFHSKDLNLNILTWNARIPAGILNIIPNVDHSTSNLKIHFYSFSTWFASKANAHTLRFFHSLWKSFLYSSFSNYLHLPKLCKNVFFLEALLDTSADDSLLLKESLQEHRQKQWSVMSSNVDKLLNYNGINVCFKWRRTYMPAASTLDWKRIIDRKKRSSPYFLK